MSNTNHNEPLGLRIAPARTSASSLPSPFPPGLRPPLARPESARSVEEKKKTKNGAMILDPQPDDSMNDPLNWPSWRRDIALLSLGFYCMLGGGMTPVLAAGFSNVASTYHVSIPQVALTTGFYMMGLGLGSVIASPTAILFGKRPVYLVCILLFVVSAIWCALSPNYPSLVVARIFMGMAVSPCECLPSATIAEIFFLHERAYRLGVYTLLLLSGKNLIPLISAAIIQSLGWQWVFWWAILQATYDAMLTMSRIVAIVVGFCFVLMFLFVPETFWDRTPRPHAKSKKTTFASISAIFHHPPHERTGAAPAGEDGALDLRRLAIGNSATATGSAGPTIAERRQQKSNHHIGFADNAVTTEEDQVAKSVNMEGNMVEPRAYALGPEDIPFDGTMGSATSSQNPERPERLVGAAEVDSRAGMDVPNTPTSVASHSFADKVVPSGQGPATPDLRNFNSPFYLHKEESGTDYINNKHETPSADMVRPRSAVSEPATPAHSQNSTLPKHLRYTTHLRTAPPKSFSQTLKPWNGKLRNENWFLVALRPFILFAYPAILWSALIYSLSIGWLIVLSESVSTIYRSRDTYNFSALGAGLVYISPFLGGILGTAVAGKVSDLIVRYMSRRNGGVYEPEFRLVMAIPITIATCIGLMGYGWSAQEKDRWIVPTVFFGIISFGCSLGSTTSITFAVDSYRQYAGEALVTLNFSKNIFHGLVFSLFFNRWLEADGAKNVFLAVGGIQLACLATTVPMYVYGKRARMWTVRRNFMEKF